MKIVIVSIGKTKDSSLSNLAADYLSRIRRYNPCEQVEIKECKEIYSKDMEKIVQAEGDKLLPYTGGGSYSIALDEKGKAYSSKEFSAMLSAVFNSGRKAINFIVGGPFGLCEHVRKNSDLVLSLSGMTFPHELAKVVLLEQLYRALTIMKGQKYHY